MKLNRKKFEILAFTRIELAIVIGVLSLLTFVLLPVLTQNREDSHRQQCVNNLKWIGIAYKTWSLDCNDSYPMQRSTNDSGTKEFVLAGQLSPHFQAMSNELTTPKLLACPADVRMPAKDFEHLRNENISYFVGLDASDYWINDFLSGDRNITNGVAPVTSILALNPKISTGWTATMHINQGNVGLADGSVQQYSIARLQRAVQIAGATNRIALPE